MVKVVISKLHAAKTHKLAKTRVRGHTGKYIDVFTIDGNSATFEDELTQVFKKNVAKARRENKRLFGSPDAAHTPLTPRERQIMQWVAVGKSDEEIALILGIDAITVSSHAEKAKKKLDARRRTYADITPSPRPKHVINGAAKKY